jgi:hypothetical protein
MVELLDIAFVLGGAVLLFFGAVLSVYGVALLGAALGAGGGYLFAPTVGGFVGLEGVLAIAAAIPIGAIAGVALTYLLLSFAVAAVSFVVGVYFGTAVIAPAVGISGLAVIGVGVVVGLLAAAVGSIMTKTMMILITSAMGAALASRKLTLGNLEIAQSEFAIDPLVFEVDPLFVGLFALGVLSQLGLFKLGWVTKVVGALPGARRLRDRGEDEAA